MQRVPEREDKFDVEPEWQLPPLAPALRTAYGWCRRLGI